MKTKAYDYFKQGNIAEARKLCETLSATTPDDAQVWHLLGLIYARQQLFKEAEAALLRALGLEKTAHTLLSLGQLYLVTNMLEDAKICFEQALEIEPDNVDMHTGLASVFGATDKPDLAISHYQKIVNLNAATADTYGNLATLYFQLRDDEKAKTAAKKSISMGSNNIAGNLLLSRIDRKNNKFEESIVRLSDLLKVHKHPSAIVSIATELGLALDRSGNYDEAYKSFETANNASQLIIDNIGYEKKDYTDTIRLYRESFPLEKQDDVQSAESNSSTNRPVFFVGFPRSGTTLLEQILTANPNIETTAESPLITNLINFAKEKFSEKGEYPDLLNHLDDSDVQLLRVEYFSNLQKVIEINNETVSYIDKLPLNLIELGFVNKIFPDAKIIMAYRDPRDVCLSCFMNNFKLNPAMSHFTSLGETVNLYSKVMDLWEHYKEKLGLDYYEYKYEDLVENTVPIAKELVEFIGQDWANEMEDFYKYSAVKKINTPSYIDVTSPVYTRSVNHWKCYPEKIKSVSNILQPYIDKFGYS